LCGALLVVDPSDGKTLYFATGGTIWKTSDGGTHWVAAATGLGGAPRALAVESGVVFAATSLGLFRSDDAGASWHAIGSGLPGNDYGGIAVEAQNPLVLYATPYNVGGLVYKSESGGE
jgi:photosystem II stability/assembly factor-like uncharacterized protein